MASTRWSRRRSSDPATSHAESGGFGSSCCSGTADVGRLRAALDEAHHLVAAREPPHAGADGDDDAREVAALGRTGTRPASASGWSPRRIALSTGFRPGREHLDEHLALTGFGRRNLDDLEHLWATELGESDFVSPMLRLQPHRHRGMRCGRSLPLSAVPARNDRGWPRSGRLLARRARAPLRTGRACRGRSRPATSVAASFSRVPDAASPSTRSSAVSASARCSTAPPTTMQISPRTPCPRPTPPTRRAGPGAPPRAAS